MKMLFYPHEFKFLPCKHYPFHTWLDNFLPNNCVENHRISEESISPIFDHKIRKIAARKLKQDFIAQAKQKDIPVKLAEEVFREKHAGIVQRLGSRHVDELFND